MSSESTVAVGCSAKLAKLDRIGVEHTVEPGSRSIMGFILSNIVIPALLIAYLAWFIADFYVFKRDVVTSTQTNQFGQTVVYMDLQCIAKGGCWWTTTSSSCTPIADFSSDAGSNRNGKQCYYTKENEKFDITHSCLIYSSDPIDSFTVAWLKNGTGAAPAGLTSGNAAAYFPVSLMNPTIDTKSGYLQSATTASTKLFKGSSLLSLVQLVDPRRTANQTINQLSPSVVSTDATLSSTFICNTAYVPCMSANFPTLPGGPAQPTPSPCPQPPTPLPACDSIPQSAQYTQPGCSAMPAGSNRQESDFYMMQLRPFPLITVQTTTILTPWAAVFGIVGGIYSLLMVGGGFLLKILKATCPKVIGSEPTDSKYNPNAAATAPGGAALQFSYAHPSKASASAPPQP